MIFIPKNKTKLKLALLILALIFLFGTGDTAFAQGYTYTPMEEIPGFGRISNFPAYILAIYQFGIWTVGIAAMLMIIIGGFMYMTAAGNTSKAGTAKTVITDAIYGLIVALAAYLLLFIINPDLVGVDISMSPSAAPTTAPGRPTSPIPPPAPPGPNCTGGRCSNVDNAIANNSSGVNSALMKSIVVGGEGCNSANSPRGACGYSQVMPLIRNAYCGGATCEQLRADTQLDINCGAAYIRAEIEPYCHGDARCTGACYNLGMTICRRNPNNCGESYYCQRVQTYYNNCSG
jgi:hypothetical protein